MTSSCWILDRPCGMVYGVSMNTYRLYTDSNKTDVVAAAPSPAKALKVLCDEAGLTLASQNGRYGKTDDGQSVSAMTQPAGRARYSDHGTTRLHYGEGLR